MTTETRFTERERQTIRNALNFYAEHVPSRSAADEAEALAAKVEHGETMRACEFCGDIESVADISKCDGCGRDFCDSCGPYRDDDAPNDLCEDCCGVNANSTD